MIGLSKNKGFTLIELLVVIAIIGLLASIVLVSMQGIRAKARDSKRLLDLEQMYKAIEMYFVYHEDVPGWGSCNTTNCKGVNWLNCSICQNGNWWEDANDIYGLLKSDGLITLPKDPINDSTYNYVYEAWTGADSTYYICVNLEKTACPTPYGGFWYGNCCWKGGACPTCH